MNLNFIYPSIYLSIYIFIMSKIEIPDDILDIIFYYKKQINLIKINTELKIIKSTCMNCQYNKICMYNCYECKKKICFECRYKDLNDGYVDKNDFEFFYKCDKCDMRNYHFNICHSKSEDDNDYYDYYNDNRNVSYMSDCF